MTARGPETTAPAAVPAGAPTGTGAPAGAGTPARKLGGLHPGRRSDLRISGPLRRGPATIHLVRDPVAARTYELGPKEHYVLSHLDGERTLAEIGDAYTARFGTRLGDAHWTRLLGLLGTRRLLAGAPLPATPPPPAPRNTVLDGRTRLVSDAPALMDRLHRGLRPLLTRWPLALGAALLVAMLAVLALDAPDLLTATGTALHQPATVVAVLVLLQLSMAGHELAHGLAARSFGGTVTEFGLRWRLPMFYPYCTVEDVHFLPRRRQQVVTAAAGALANLLFLVPFAVGWLLLPVTAEPRPAVAALLVLGVGTAAANLVPLPPLDGYKIVGYGLGLDRLAVESRRFLGLLLRRRPVTAYPPRLRWVLAGYGTFVALVAAAGTAAFVLVGYRVLADRWGPGAGLAPAALLVVLLALWGVGLLARRRQHSKEVVA